MAQGGMNPQKMLKQMQKMQEDMARVQAELQQESVTAQAGGGAVTARVSGGLELLEITIDPEAVAKMSRSERYDFIAKVREQRWQQHQAVRTAARELFATLDEKQKDVADDALPGLGGFGPGMMHGGRRGGPGYGWR